MRDIQNARAERAVILIVEDDFFVRFDAVQMIKAAGYEALEAENADAAMVILERRSDVAVVFTDIQMPGAMDGLELAAAVNDRWPPIKIIATSGDVGVHASDLPAGG